ncbi:MAG: sporulation protein [Limnohabitans sp.]|nr:sporulation protein [Limnohabitans sp.]
MPPLFTLPFASPAQRQRGGTLLGFIFGLIVGLSVALSVAIYVTKVPIPFLNKGVHRTPDQDAAEEKKNKDWDPNAPLYGKNPVKPPEKPAEDAPAVIPPPSTPPQPTAGEDPLGDLARSRAATADPFNYFVQAGAFRSADEAESQRAKLALQGFDARVSEREQSGRTVFRVRIGPLDSREEAERIQHKLASSKIDAALVRVQR